MLTLRNMIPYYRFTPAKTKFVLVIVSVTVLIAGVAPAATILKVDFNSDQDGGGNSAAAGDPSLSPANHNQPGWSSYHANHEVAAEFTTANYGGITLTPVWPNTTNNNVRQSIDRSAANDASWDNSLGYLNLVTDWIGIDTRTASGGNGDWDGVNGTPTYMELRIGGLSAGGYNWISFHHDTENCHGPFAVWLSTDSGATFTQLADGWMTDGSLGGTPDSGATESGPDPFLLSSAYRTTFIANGTDDVIMRFAPYSGIAVHRQIWGINGFILETSDPCFNMPPTIQAPGFLVARTNTPVLIKVTVTDDGRPYEEGCDPENPSAGDPYGLTLRWVQTSGPAPITFVPPAADAEDITAVFTLPGTYELTLYASDGPTVDGPDDVKTSEHTLTVDVQAPLYGDIDGDGFVDLNDLNILAAQWLSTPDCFQEQYCADLDVSGHVAGADFAMLSENWLIQSSRVLINEFVASNRLSLLDGDGNSSDWIELHNPDTQAVSLDGWYLTDDPDDLRKWSFPPQTTIAAGGYLVVFASDQPTDNYVDPLCYLHTNFALSKNGEYLALVAPNGTIVHEYRPRFPPQQTDISYGMWHSTQRYFAATTPGAANQQAFLGFTEKPSHNYKRGFYSQPFDLRIFCDTPDAIIHYTLDGSEPTEQSGLLYDPEVPIRVTTTSLVRSVAFKPGYRPSAVTTHTYIFIEDVARQPADPPGWPSDWGYNDDPIIQGIVPADYEMDPRVVDNTLPGYSVQEALLDIPTVSIAMAPDDFISDTTGIYANPLSRWERKCSVEYILPDGTEGFQENCKIEVHGNASRRPARMQKHSLRLTFTSLYGSPKLEYPLFDDCSVEQFNQLVLRACFTDSWALVSWVPTRYRPNDSMYIRDVWMKESLGAMGQPTSHGNFVHLYVNGLYFGLHNLTERLAPDFFADHLGGRPEEWQVNEDFATSPPRWNAMMAIDPSTPAGYAQMQQYLDVENYADYILLHLYADAEDWPHANGYAAVNPVSGDGRFRFFVWDQEIVLDYHGRAASRIGDTSGAGIFFQKMRTSDEFRLLFADRVYKHCFNGGALSQTASQERFRRIADRIDKAIVAESARWGDTQMSTPYGNEIEQPNPLDDVNHLHYPPAPHGPDYYFTREDSWLLERDNVINNYIPAIHDTANSYALINILRTYDLYPPIDPPLYQVGGVSQHGGRIAPGDALTMVNPNPGGVIYFTLDGTDPRLPAASHTASRIVLVPEDAPKKVWIGAAPSPLWTGDSEPYDDYAWTHGSYVEGRTGGVGYDLNTEYLPWITYDVKSLMYNTGNQLAYVRIPFTADPTDLIGATFATLRMRYDDGFVAYLNGHEIARSPGVKDNPWTTTSHNTTGFEEFSVLQHLDKLKAGDNILAILGLNYGVASTDFLVSAELVAGTDDQTPPDISPTARVYTSALTLTQSTLVKARVRDNGTWSALSEAVFAVGPVRENLRLTELMYHAPDPDTEYIELCNIGSESINLAHAAFTRGIKFTFPSLTLAPGAYCLVVANRSAFENRYGPDLTIAGEYTGLLDNAGERITLVDAAGAIIHDFRYSDNWFDVTDGGGFSLTVRDPAADPALLSRKSAWQPSMPSGGSPGTAETHLP